MRPHCHCYYIPNLQTYGCYTLDKSPQIVPFFVLPPSQYIIIALNVFSPKKHYLLAKYYRVLLWDSFVCACHKIGNQKHSGLPSDQNWNCFTVKIFSSFKKPFHFHTIIISVNFRYVNYAYYFRRS